MTPFSQCILLLWFPAAIFLFATLPKHRALTIGVTAALMFLPMSEYPIHFLPLNKATVIPLGLFIAMLVLDPNRLGTFRPQMIDLPALMIVLTPIASSLANDLSLYDATAAATGAFVIWGMPYLLGRVYLTDVLKMRDLAIALFVGGLIYIPLCLLELRVGPECHHLLYGYYQHDYIQTIRMGGFRPMVFMQHGLMVGLFMSMAAMSGIWLWWTGSVRTLRGLPVILPVMALTGTAVLCKSAGAVVLLATGLGALFVSKFIKNYLVLVLILVIPWAYMGLRTVGGWQGDELMDVAQDASHERADSLGVRFGAENQLIAKAMTKPMFGWGPGGRNLIFDESGKIKSIPDGLWVMSLGSSGIIGLVSLFAMMLVAPTMMLWRYRAKYWGHPAFAGAAIFTVILMLWAIDCLMNAMINPIYLVGLGGLSALASAPAPRPGPPRRPGPMRSAVPVQRRGPRPELVQAVR